MRETIHRPLDSPLLRRAAAVVRQWRHVFNRPDIQPGVLERGDGRLAARPRPLDLHIQLAEAELDGLCGAVLLGLSIVPADAFKKTNLPGTRSKDYIKDLCSGPGRQYVEGQGQYGCISDCGEGRESALRARPRP